MSLSPEKCLKNVWWSQGIVSISSCRYSLSEPIRLKVVVGMRHMYRLSAPCQHEVMSLSDIKLIKS